jgi:hypothetical protein
MSKQLLVEYQVFTPVRRPLRENVSTAGNLIVSGLIQACDRPNANKRIYPYDTLFSQVEKYIDGPIKESRALGELDHPESSIINLKNVSHNIVKLWWEGKSLYGDIEVLPTPSGNIVKALFENNVTVGISSRAMGSVSSIGEGLVRVEDDLELVGWDFVSQPSTFGAYVKPKVDASAINESIEYQHTPYKYDRASRIISDILCTVGNQCCIR